MEETKNASENVLKRLVDYSDESEEEDRQEDNGPNKLNSLDELQEVSDHQQFDESTSAVALDCSSDSPSTLPDPPIDILQAAAAEALITEFDVDSEKDLNFPESNSQIFSQSSEETKAESFDQFAAKSHDSMVSESCDELLLQSCDELISESCEQAISESNERAVCGESYGNSDLTTDIAIRNTDSTDDSRVSSPNGDDNGSVNDIKLLPLVMLEANDDSSLEGLSIPFSIKSSDMKSDSCPSVTSSLVQCEDSNMSLASEISKEGPDETTDLGKEGECVKEVKKKTPAKRRPDLTIGQLTGGHKDDGLTAEHLYEYKWPPESRSDWYMIQEQVSEFLGVKSFKRKYPDLERRNIEASERVFLREKGVVTEMMADLGLTAVRSDLVHDLMSKDYPLKYKEYVAVLKERKKQQAIERQREIQAQKTDKTRLEMLRQKAMKSTASFNASLNRERREDRRAYFDVHTFEVQFPKDAKKVLPKEVTKVGAYPVALIPGQFQDYHKRYSPQEMKYLPLNTAVYSSPRKQSNIYADPDPGSEGEEVSTESSEQSSVEELSDNESVEIASDMFEDDDLVTNGNEEVDGESTPEPGKSREEKKQEIDRKVQEILTKLNYKESRKGKRGRPPLSEIAKYFNTPTKKGRKVAAEGETGSEEVEVTPSDSPALQYRPMRPPRRSRKVKEKETITCNICGAIQECHSAKQVENFVQCSVCSRYGHPSCLELTTEMIEIIKTYPWQCMECKTCVKCNDSQHEDKMLFCDHCDRGYHTFCVGLQAIPNGRWECPSCRPPVEVPQMVLSAVPAEPTAQAAETLPPQVIMETQST